jgi:hypothetical protein
MSGAGYYRKHSTTQHGATGFGLPLIERAAAELTPPEPAGPIFVADFGAAQGSNSLGPIATGIDAIRRAAPHAPVCVVHTDLPGNAGVAATRGGPRPWPSPARSA